MNDDYTTEQERRDIADGRVPSTPLVRLEARANETRTLAEWLRDHDGARKQEVLLSPSVPVGSEARPGTVLPEEPNG